VIVSEMDKSWMHSDRRSKAYEFGVEAFLNFAGSLYFNGIDQSYKNWTFHGEPWEATTNASRNVEDGHSRYSFVSEEIDMDDNDFGDFGDFGSDPYEFANVIGDGDQPVYPGCRKYTKLSALVKLYNLKAKHGMSDVCFTELLILQGDLLPEGNTIPTSMYEAKKTLCALGLSYEKMHACPNDCILYRKEYEDSTNCPTCGISRWKQGKDSILKEGVPAKVVWYFPPIPRQHMIHIKTAYPKFRKRTKLLQDKHNSTFIQWLRFKVQSELEEDNNGVSENLRWLAAGPNMAVPLYRSYLIKGIKFNIKAQDDVRTTQNSGVYLLAQTMQVASAKDKNQFSQIWVSMVSFKKFGTLTTKSLQSQSLVDELGFTLVDLSKIGHRNDQFVLASQVKQIFFVDDPMHRGWSVVLSMPNREYNDVIGDEVLGDVIIECEPFTRGMPNVDTFDELVGELGGQNIRDGFWPQNNQCKKYWIQITSLDSA
ncbi:hypothetical protein Prudu_42S000200, partial [Prunus dulcis]